MQVSHLDHVEYGDNTDVKDCCRVSSRILHSMKCHSSALHSFSFTAIIEDLSLHSSYMSGTKSGQEMEIKLSL